MSLNSRTVAKILRETFTGEQPIIKDAFEHKAFIASIKENLKNIKRLDFSSHYSSHTEKDKDLYCYFSVKENDEDRYWYYSSDSFTIKFNQHNQLMIEQHLDSFAMVYHVDQIYAFIDKLKLAHQEKNARRLKKKKINGLKQQAIIAKIKEIAKEDQFDFFTREYDKKLKLTVRIKDGSIMEIDIPYGKFQDILKDLRSLIKTVRELQKGGIIFKLKSSSGYKSRSGWTTYESL
jgi:hypothetical protein